MLVPARAPDLVDALSEPALFLGSELPCLDSDACEENLEYSTELTQEEKRPMGRRLMRFAGETASCKTSGVQDVLEHVRAHSLIAHDIMKGIIVFGNYCRSLKFFFELGSYQSRFSAYLTMVFHTGISGNSIHFSANQ